MLFLLLINTLCIHFTDSHTFSLLRNNTQSFLLTFFPSFCRNFYLILSVPLINIVSSAFILPIRIKQGISIIEMGVLLGVFYSKHYNSSPLGIACLLYFRQREKLKYHAEFKFRSTTSDSLSHIYSWERYESTSSPPNMG